MLGSTAAPGGSGTATAPAAPATTSPPASEPASTAPAETTGPRTELRIQIWERGRKAGAPIERTLRCDGTPAGTVADPVAACRALAALGGRAVAPVPASMACTMIYGGASEATIDGILAGRPVAASYSLQNGCEIARWNRLSTILAAHTPAPTSATP